MTSKKIAHSSIAGLSGLIILLSQLIILSSTQAKVLVYAPDEIIPRFNCYFADKMITDEPSADNFHLLRALTKENLQLVEEKLVGNDFGLFGKSWFKKKNKFLNYISTQLNDEHLYSAVLSAEEKKEILNQVKSIYYMIAAEERMVVKDAVASSARDDSASKQIETALRLVKRRKIFQVKVPRDSLQVIGGRQAQLEAKNLVNKEEGVEKILTVEELQKKSVQQLADLDIPANHPMWYQFDKHMSEKRPWQKLENFLSKEMTTFLSKEFKLQEKFPQFNYRIEEAHKVLFFDEIKESGTSPKIGAKDSFDQKWKLKWSAEIHSEPIANRLYLALGAKYVDQVYVTKPGVSGLVLILGDQKKQEKLKAENKKICYPVTAAEFLKCMEKSKYQSSIASFVYSSGVITAENKNDILKNLHPASLKDYQKDQLVGRHYVTFKEASVEFSPSDVVVRGGPTTWTRFGAKEDRVRRGLLLFNSWINNIDPNEDNGRGYLLPQMGFVHGQHDMGFSLTGFLGPAYSNEFSVSDFFYPCGGSVCFNYFVFYLPGAWQSTTYSDLLWMGKKIVPFKKSQIADIVSSTHLPDFVQEALVYKLMMRRNKIAQVLKLEHLLPPGEGEKEITAPSLSVPLSTLEERKLAAERYQLPFELLEEAYQKSIFKSDNYQDEVLKRGRVSSCPSTILIRLLHQYRHPTGLDRRLLNLDGITGKLPKNLCGGVPLYDVNKFIRKVL